MQARGNALDMGDRLLVAAVALVVVQVVHGAIPADTPDAEGWVGFYAGIVGIVSALAAVFGLRRGASWARPVAAATGVGVAVGFVLYHGLPWHSAFTNPYWEDGIGAAQWAGVIAAVAIAIWCAYEAMTARQPALPAPA